MAEALLLTRLAQHRALGAAPAHEHAWLAGHGALRAFAVGDVVIRKGESVTSLHIMLTGHLVIRVDRGAGSHKIFEWRAGDVGGLMPYSRGASPPADAVAEAPTELLDIGREHFPEMIRECPAVTAILVHAMVDRARKFTLGDYRDEKLISLGRLAAGLAHELNNPASAAARNAKSLIESLAGAEAAARRLGAARLSDAQLSALDDVREVCLRSDTPLMASAVVRADREDEFAAWLAAHGASEQCAVALAETSIKLEALDTLAATVGREALDVVLQWIAAGCQVRRLAAHIEKSASRISSLVGAVKGFTFMDNARTPGPVDIRGGITDTLAILGAKVRDKSVAVSVQLAADLPRAHGVGAELNQVWMNLIDNALDAVAAGGHVEVTASEAPGRVVVRIIDNGPGIPASIQGRVFDPFFTTKGVGKGTGLGLAIARRLVQQHEGEIEVESRPGHTEFRVSLPVGGGRPSSR
jgi:signal transduction histidine kinase